jgi:tight adherence protein C
VIGILVGLLFALGALMALQGWRAGGPPPPLLAALHRVPAHAPERRADPLLDAIAPMLDLLARLFGGRAALRRKLQLAGWHTDPERYLMGQVMRAGASAALAALLLAATGSLGRTGPALLTIGLAAVAGLLLGDWLLGRAAQRRRATVAEQFPVAAQLLALLISAGSSPSAAVGRVGQSIGGPLGAQFQAAAQRTAAGEGFSASMRMVAAEVELPVIERFVHGLLAAIERGSPLAEIVREQAIDAAAESHRQLMTAAGKRDIAMLVPVVFVVLPTVVMVSLLPGALQLGLFGG